MKQRIIIGFIFVVLFSHCMQQNTTQNRLQEATSNGYTYQYVPNDPLGVRIYTLANGLQVYLSAYTASPRIYTSLAVRAGGKNDPADNTGLAHYLEHIMFKGTSEFGTNDWQAESVLLDSIERLYNQYGSVQDSAQRSALYEQIDQVSNQASAYAIPNEYDKMLAFIGATGTNAYTSNDRTVYINDIPSNQLESFLRIERNRFGMITPRLFHTELEAVYEEKNRSLDNDGWRVYETLLASAFRNHPYGTQTVIGTVEHLQNPSITEIRNFFNTYYRPNNVTICLSGDLDYDTTITLIDRLFGDWEANAELPVYESPVADPITEIIEEEVIGPEAENVTIAFRFGGRNSQDYKKLLLTDYVLSNAQAGLIDLNLRQAQHVLSPSSFIYDYNDYSLHLFYGRPRAGQTLEEVRDLLLEQIEHLKQGNFPDWLLPAIINDFKKSHISKLESNSERVGSMVEAATSGINWGDYVAEIEDISTYTKQDIIDFANQYYSDNYVVIYKRTGTVENPKVYKPAITPVQLNRDQISSFQQSILDATVADIQPVFLDYEQDIRRYATKRNVPVYHVSNTENDRFSLYFYSDLTNRHSPEARLAIRYLDYLAPVGMTPEEFKQELYKIGADIHAQAGNNNSYVQISGLAENTAAALDLVEQLLNNPQANPDALTKLVAGIKKERADDTRNKNSIRRRLVSYGLYGSNSPMTNVLTNDQLDQITPEQLIDIIKAFPTTEHRVLYYGPTSQDALTELLDQYHVVPDTLAPLTAPINFQIQAVTTPTVFWADYDMVQAEMIFASRNELYDPALSPAIWTFNEYFGGGMSAIVFQELREARGLAYSTYATYRQGNAEKYNSFIAYVGSQADKQAEALSAMRALIDSLPASQEGFEIAQQSILSKLRTERVIRERILFNYESAQRKGIDYDLRRDVYEQVQVFNLESIQRFHSDHVRNNPFHLLILGSRDKLDFNSLSAYGAVQEVSLDVLFGYTGVPE